MYWREHGRQLRLDARPHGHRQRWTECFALLERESSVIVEALDRLRMTLPFPLRGIDTDNGGEVTNSTGQPGNIPTRGNTTGRSS
jgi:hypothetical protein